MFSRRWAAARKAKEQRTLGMPPNSGEKPTQAVQSDMNCKHPDGSECDHVPSDGAEKMAKGKGKRGK